MKIIVTHASPDLDALTSVWLIKKFLPDWADAEVRFVQAGERLKGSMNSSAIIEKIGGDEYLHVDTGLGPLDHHQTEDENTSAASLTWDYIKNQLSSRQWRDKYQKKTKEKWQVRIKAIERILKVIVEIDHFRELFWDNPTADYHEFTLPEIIEGLKLAKPDNDMYYLDFGIKALDALLHNFENRIEAEKEIKEDGIKFKTSFGEGIGFETLNDSILKLAQRMGFVIVVRKDPRKGYVRIKARPAQGQKGVDLTLVYEQLKKMDPQATWFLHVSKKMLLNSTTKNPNMKPTKLSLGDIIKVLEQM